MQTISYCVVVGDEFTTLMTQCKEGAIREGRMLDSQEELYKWFTEQVTMITTKTIITTIKIIITKINKDNNNKNNDNDNNKN